MRLSKYVRLTSGIAGAASGGGGAAPAPPPPDPPVGQWVSIFSLGIPLVGDPPMAEGVEFGPGNAYIGTTAPLVRDSSAPLVDGQLDLGESFDRQARVRIEYRDSASGSADFIAGASFSVNSYDEGYIESIANEPPNEEWTGGGQPYDFHIVITPESTEPFLYLFLAGPLYDPPGDQVVELEFKFYVEVRVPG